MPKIQSVYLKKKKPSETNWRNYLFSLSIFKMNQKEKICKYNWLIALQSGFISLTLNGEFLTPTQLMS